MCASIIVAVQLLSSALQLIMAILITTSHNTVPENLLVLSHQVVDDDVRSPEVIYHVAPDVDLTGGPVGRAVQDHPRFRPHQLVRPANADLLESKDNTLSDF